MKALLKLIAASGVLMFSQSAFSATIDADNCTDANYDDNVAGTYTVGAPNGGIGNNKACWGKNQPNGNISDALLEQIVGAAEGSLSLVYKNNQGGGEEGSFFGSYSTTYSNGNQNALIEYTGGSVIDCVTTSCYLIVKDGNNNPRHYIFDISGWNGTTALNLIDFWTGNGSISHVSIHSGGAQVPEPMTLLLLGAGLVGLGVRRRLMVKA